MAAGYLQWPPDIIWEAPISQVFLALEGRADFVVATNPFGGGKSKKAGTKVDQAELERQKALEKNKVRALKFDMMTFNARHKSMGMS